MKKITLVIALFMGAMTMNAQADCENAAALTADADATTTVSVDALSGEAPDPACVTAGDTTAANGAWYTLTTDEDLLVTITTDLDSNGDGSADDYYLPVLNLLTGTCGDLTCSDADFAFSDTAGTQIFAEVTFLATAGTTYYVVFDDLYNQTGQGGLSAFDFEVTTTSELPEAPGVATNPTPEDGATGVAIGEAQTGESTVDFSWDAPTDGAEVVNYTIVISTDETFPQASSISGTFQDTDGTGLYLPGEDFFTPETTYYWMIIPNSAGGSTSEEDVQTWSFTTGTLGLDDFSKDAFTQYVQAGVLNVESNTQIQSITLFNILGQQVATQKINNTKGNVSLSQLNSGVYLAKVQLDGQTKTFKFVKK